LFERSVHTFGNDDRDRCRMIDTAPDDQMQAVVLTETNSSDQYGRWRGSEDRFGLAKSRRSRHLRPALEPRGQPGKHREIVVNDENRRRLNHCVDRERPRGSIEAEQGDRQRRLGVRHRPKAIYFSWLASDRVSDAAM